jgi:hypothetical protein
MDYRDYYAAVHLSIVLMCTGLRLARMQMSEL